MCRSWYAYQEKESFPHLVGSQRTAKAYLSIYELLSSANCAILVAGNVSRSAGYFPSSAAVEGKRHFRFSPCRLLQVAGFVHARRDVQRFPPRQYFLSLSSGGRSEQGPRVGIPLDTFHSATSVGLPQYLEGPAGSVALDSLYDPVRLHTPICSQPLQRVLLTAVNSASEASVLQQEVTSLLKRVIEEVSLFGSTQWLLQPVNSSSEEGWWFASYTRSAQAELLPLQREIQDVDVQEHSFPGPRVGLVRYGRPEGCLLPHPGSLEAQEVPQVRLRGKGLPVQGSSLWANSGPMDVHQVYGCSSGPAEAPGHPYPQLPGQLAYFSKLQGASDSSEGLSPSPPSRAWPLAEWSFQPSRIFFWESVWTQPRCRPVWHSVVQGPLQARSAHVSGQAPRPHGGSFPG